MDYKQMRLTWLKLKDAIEEEVKYYKNLNQGDDDTYYKGREDEANDILDEMYIIEKMMRKYFEMYD